MTMRILYDGQIYGNLNATGITRYFYHLIQELPSDFLPTLLAINPQAIYPTHPRLKIYRYSDGFSGGLGARLSYRFSKYYFRLASALSRPQILHPIYYSRLTQQAMNQRSCPLVITIYDLIHEQFAQQLDPEGYVASFKQRAVEAADRILCISENTRQDLIRFYPIAETKAITTLLATELDLSLITGSDPVPDRPYYLQVGSRAFYKNFDRLLEAFAKAVSVHPDLALCVVGAPLSEAEQRRIAELQLTDHIEFYGSVDDRHLAKLYHHSLALVYPSLYEGFGIPPLEAMACETAVIAARSSSIPEVVGDAAWLFDPLSVVELADRLIALVDHPTERDRLIERGKERVKQFSWKKMADQTVELYRSLLNV
ncbi:MAG: glycosyltransferase family 1 protein [Leptolyngbyaceae cyanobacterium bins.59]|nr:glycosyltransferase family 1 protein [Leptolyngbyaceae cyanobacterium bins.59]